jgi:UDP-2-acetamido-3-amino-2,3-dideoxy-glucuronate N-acetyltransferase
MNSNEQNSPGGLRVGVIGAGYWGENLLRNFDALGTLAALCEVDAAARDAQSAAYPRAAVFDNADSLFADPTIEAVAIATPAATHGGLVKQALAAGKHIFVEKPLCLDVEEGKRLARDATAKGLTLMVGHLLLYHPAFVALRRCIDDGELGDLRYIYSNRLSLGKVRREENALWSFAPHDISMILALTGTLPSRVAATGGYYLSHDVADTTLSHLTFDSGVQAHVFVSWLHPFKDQRLVVVGTRGMAAFNDVAQGADKLLYYPLRQETDGDVPVLAKADAKPIAYDTGEPLRRECQAFLDAVSGGVAPPSDAAEGLRVLTVLDACQRSIQSGAPVTLHAEAVP